MGPITKAETLTSHASAHDYLPRGEYYGIVGYVYQVASAMQELITTIEVGELEGQGLTECPNHFSKEMAEIKSELDSAIGIDDNAFNPAMASGRIAVSDVLGSTVELACDSIDLVGPLPMAGLVDGESGWFYPKQWDKRDQIAAFLLDERRGSLGTLDASQSPSTPGKYQFTPSIELLSSESFNSTPYEDNTAQKFTWQNYIYSQYNKSLMKGLDSSRGQQQYMKFMSSIAILLEATYIKYQR